MSRLNEKNELLIKLGALFAPLDALARVSAGNDAQDKAEAVARYTCEQQTLVQSFAEFKMGQPGHDYNLEYKKFITALAEVPRRIERGESLVPIVEQQRAAARDAISAVPIPRSSVILEAGSPFTAYCKLRSLCEADVISSVTWVDRYFSQDIFHRYLQHVRETAKVTIVTCAPPVSARTNEVARWNAFLDLSRIFGKERGPSNYQLLVAPSVHDRWLLVDGNRIYQLGGSAKDAASKDHFTIAVVEPSQTNLNAIASLSNMSVEWFGPSTLTHQ